MRGGYYSKESFQNCYTEKIDVEWPKKKKKEKKRKEKGKCPTKGAQRQ